MHARSTPLLVGTVALAVLMVVMMMAVLTVAYSRICPGRAPRPDEHIVYKQVDGHSLALHVFHARVPPAAGLPAGLLLFHGGAWAHGSAAQFHPQCLHFSQLGLTCISAEYRVRSRHGTSPADALQDARDAMRHLRRHGAALGLDPQRIAAGGGSAGGHLAAALGVGVSLPDPQADPGASTRPDTVLLLNPMLDLGPGRPDHDLVASNWMTLSPRHHIGPGMPPTLILSGTADADVPVATVEDFCAAVRLEGGLCDAVFFDGAGHGFFNPGVAQGKYVGPVYAAAEQFLRERGLL